MHQRIGRWMVYTGIILIVIGLLVGFGAMFESVDSVAIRALGLVPIGFVILLAGTVATQLSAPANKETKTMDHEEPL